MTITPARVPAYVDAEPGRLHPLDAGLGVVMVRALRERRRRIGMMRAMGLPTNTVRRAARIRPAVALRVGE